MWSVLIEEDVLNFLESLGKRRAESMKEHLRALKESPYPGQGFGDKKEIKGSGRTDAKGVYACKSAFRMRIGDYRAFYVIEKEEKTVKITEIMTAEAAHKKYGRV